MTASLVAVPGPLYRFDLIRIDANPTQPPDLIRNALPLAQGDPILADAVLAAEASVSVGMQENGYPFAKIGARDIALDPAAATGDYTLHVDTGDRSRFGGFRSDGKLAFSPKHVGELTRFSRGDRTAIPYVAIAQQEEERGDQEQMSGTPIDGRLLH